MIGMNIGSLTDLYTTYIDLTNTYINF